MNQNIKRSLLLCALVSFVVMCVPLTVSAVVEAPTRETDPLPKLFSENIQIYRSLLEAGKKLEAKEYLQQAISLLADSPKKESLLSELYELNMQILFSRTETPNSTMYEVKAGDTLSKIAKSYGTTIELIMKSNGIRNHIIRPGEKFKIFTGTFKIRVDKSDNILTLYADDEIMKVYRVATGKNNSTPVGEYVIESKLKNPTWYHAGAIVAPNSPENILGTRWLGISYPGYGIHGTTMPESIGTQSTAGCVRMYNTDVEELFSIVPYGTHVEIVD